MPDESGNEPGGEHPDFQQPLWPDAAALRSVVDTLGSAPGLFGLEDILALRAELANEENLVIHVGECVETFEMLSPEGIRSRCEFASELQGHFSRGTGRPSVLILRGMGQFAKPRSSYRDEDGLVRWRGDAVNGAAPTAEVREPDPNRMSEGYELVKAGLTELNASGVRWVGHEALLLPYENGLLRRQGEVSYCSSAHFLWLGNRTRSSTSPQARLLRRAANPFGIKVDATCTPAEMLGHFPHGGGIVAGRASVIVRMGARCVEQGMERLLSSPEIRELPVRWMCDPLHGNQGRDDELGRTNRPLSAVLEEVETFCRVLRRFGVQPAGLHLEASPHSDHECTGGRRRHVSHVEARTATPLLDPRLNLDQARDVIDVFSASWR